MDSISRFKIDPDIIALTSECTHGCGCLKDPSYEFCEVSHVSGTEQDLLFITNPHRSVCPYKSEFGGSHVCTCPVRKAIFNKYGV